MAGEKTCLICKDPSDEDNPILKCINCDFQAHVLCYGIINRENFTCSPCMNEVDSKMINCVICKKTAGAMKKTTEKAWVHIICALFTAGVAFIDEETMEPIDVSKMIQPKQKKICVFCSDTDGVFKCGKKGCENYLHACCGLENGSLKEIVGKKNTIRFLGYCNEHVSDEKAKRLSSDRIQLLIDKKTGKRNIEEARKKNSAWIIQQIQSKEDELQEDIDSTSSQKSDRNVSFKNAILNFVILFS